MPHTRETRSNAIGDWSFDAVFECVTEGIMLADATGHVIRMNRAMLDLIKADSLEQAVKRHEEHGSEWLPLDANRHPLPQDRWPLARAIAGEQFRDEVIEILHTGEKRHFWLSCSGTPVLDHQGNVVGSILSTRLIEPPNIAEASRSQAERNSHKLNAIIENVSEGFVIADLDGTITHMNRRVREWFDVTPGVPAHNHISKNPWRALDLDGIPLADSQRPIMRALAGETFRDLEVRWHNTDDETERLLSSNGTLVQDEDGQPVCAVVSYRDIAAQKEAERTMQDLNAELERRVEERTADLVSANRDLEGFTYTVSHDLRTPLRGITASSMILLQDYADKLDESAKAQLIRQANAAKKMALLIDDLLFLSRISRSALNVVEFNLSKIAEEVVQELKARDWPHEVRFQVESGLFVEADPRLFRFVMLNLMENACKFADRTKGATVEFGRTIVEGRPAFFVKDDGIGFDMTYVGKIFLPFERLVTDEEFSGTGSGLANARRIIERHGGEIWAESREGVGSTFFFRV